MHKRAALGIDIGGTKTLCALFDEKFKILEEVKFKTAPARGRKVFSTELTNALDILANKAKQEKLELIGAGAACAGRVNPETSSIEVSPNILCLEDYPIGKLIKRKLGIRTVIGNDVHWGLYAEHQLGAAVGCSHVLGVFFGTGVGGAVIIHGKLYEGANGFGGQVGSILTHHIGGSETMESHGILDRMASKSAIGGAALGMGSKMWAPNLYKIVGTDLSKVTWGALAKAIRSGDKEIKGLIKARMKVVGIALSSVVNFLNPEMLVLGGGLTEEMPRLVLPNVESGLREYLVPEVGRKLKVTVAKLQNRAGVYGAAKRVFETFG